jgi:hypothetical protein
VWRGTREFETDRFAAGPQQRLAVRELEVESSAASQESSTGAAIGGLEAQGSSGQYSCGVCLRASQPAAGHTHQGDKKAKFHDERINVTDVHREQPVSEKMRGIARRG